MFIFVLLCNISSFSNHLDEEDKALLLFLMVSCVRLHCVLVAIPDHNHLRF